MTGPEKSAPACRDVLATLQSHAGAENVAGMARYGINPHNTLGVPVKVLRQIARDIGRHHDLALDLWDSGVHEARILASIIELPDRVTDEQMEAWVETIDSWDVCDQACSNLFRKTPLAWEKAYAWAARDEPFVRRAGFSLLAQLAVHDRTSGDERFIEVLSLIERHADDERNFVKKAVNWALRQIGKRSPFLHTEALACAERLCARPERSARWIGRGARAELKARSPSQWKIP